MSQPQRLSESGTVEERATLASARALRPNGASKQRAMVALGVGAATTLMPHSAVAFLKGAKTASGAALKLSALKWGVVSLVAVAAAGVVTTRVAVPPSPPESSRTWASGPKPSAEKTPASPAPMPEQAATNSASAGSSSIAMPPQPVPAPRIASSPVTEIGWIDAARSKLRSGDALAALSLLEQRQRRFPNGSLALEARVLRIEALAASGSQQQAAAEAEQFLSQHPNGLLSHRLRRWLERQEQQ